MKIEVDYFEVENPVSNLGVKITVSDQGIGISKEDKEQLFKPFFRTRDEKSR